MLVVIVSLENDIFDEDIDRVNGMYGKYLLDLEDLAKENDYEATANAGLMAACRDAGGGTLKTIPYQPNVFAFFYNKDLFEQAGITEEPKTWDEFKDVCQKLKDAGITPMTMDDAYATCVIGYHLARLVGEDKVKEIAEMKMPDLNAASIEAAMSMIAGTARSMGIVVED